MQSNLPLWGLFWGALSAASLPLGALLGLHFRPSNKVTSGLMAFGGGALLFALTIELFGHVLHVASDAHGHIEKPGYVLVTMAAAIVGGLLFQGLDHLLNSQGGFLRKRSLIVQHIGKHKRAAAKRLLRSLSRIHALHALPPGEVIRLVARARRTNLSAGQTVFEQDDEGDRLYFIDTGRVLITRRTNGSDESTTIATLGAGDIFGEIALVSDTPRTATVTVEADASLIEILKDDFDEVLENAPGLKRSLHDLAQQRIEELSTRDEVDDEVAAKWRRRALARFDPGMLRMIPEDVHGEVEDHAANPNAAQGIWLGIALDGIPESLVIGMLVVNAAAEGVDMSLAFIVGVFLANLPEAMSSSVSMSNGGFARGKILWMWGSLCVMTGVGAMLGTLMIPPHAEGAMLYFVFCIEGIAAGAMLTMIAETMLPEAFEQGSGPIVGLSTLAGFIAALGVKVVG